MKEVWIWQLNQFSGFPSVALTVKCHWFLQIRFLIHLTLFSKLLLLLFILIPPSLASFQMNLLFLLLFTILFFQTLVENFYHLIKFAIQGLNHLVIFISSSIFILPFADRFPFVYSNQFIQFFIILFFQILFFLDLLTH